MLRALGLADREFIELQPFGRYTPQSTMQLADLTAWDMLEILLLPVQAHFDTLPADA